jgi:hypothetical protein
MTKWVCDIHDQAKFFCYADKRGNHWHHKQEPIVMYQDADDTWLWKTKTEDTIAKWKIYLK